LEQSYCIKTAIREGQKTLAAANKLKIVNRKLEIQRDEKFLYIPIVKKPTKEQLKTLAYQLAHCKVFIHSFPPREAHTISITQLLRNKLPSRLLADLPRVDFIGDIAVVEMPPELVLYKSIVGEAILEVNRNVRTVLAKKGPISGIYRLRDFAVIAGEPGTETVHRENGCQFHVDVAKTYFSPRLSFEHRRVSSLVKNGETIVDLFASVGSFPVQIAKNRQSVTVYAIDLNPEAVRYLIENIRINRVIGRVHPILGDARQIVQSQLLGVADRVIMNLPEKAIEFVDVACKAIKPSGGTVHFYSFIKKPDSLESLKIRLAIAVKKSGRAVEKNLFSRLVRETAPYEWQIGLDVRIR
jgi:tRNA (guanine37-N1)-methyltransferase